MDPEQLQRYASDAGLLDPTPDTPINRATAYAPRVDTSAVTDEDVLGHFIPGYSTIAPYGTDVSNEEIQMPTMDFRPVTSPGQVPDQPVTSPTPQLSPGGPTLSPEEAPLGGDNTVAPPGQGLNDLGQSYNSIDAETRGYSPTKAAQVAAGPAAQKLAQQKADIERTVNQDAAESAALEAIPAQQEARAQQALTDANVARDTEAANQQGWYLQRKNEADTRFAEKQALIEAKENKALSDYAAATADFRASAGRGVDPGQLWGRLSGEQQVGMMAVAFISDYLQAGGVRSSAMDQWNKAVERNMEAQKANIKLKGDVSDSFRSLWEAQRLQSTSESEANTRMHGFYLENLKLQVEQHMAQYQTPITQAQGALAVAKVNQELAKKVFDIKKQRDVVKNNMLGHAMEEYKADLTAAAEDAKIRAARAAAKAATAKANPLDNPENFYLYDTSENGGGHAIGELIPGMGYNPHTGAPTEATQKYLHLQAESAVMNRLINEYDEVLRKYGNKGPLDNTRLKSDDAAKLASLSTQIRSKYLLLTTGMGQNKEEVERSFNVIPDGAWLSRADASQIMGGFQQTVLDGLDQVRYGIASDFAPGDPRKEKTRHLGHFDNPSQIDAKNRFNQLGNPPPENPEDTAQKMLTSPAGDKPADQKSIKKAVDAGAAPNSDWKGFVEKNPDVPRERVQQGGVLGASSDPPLWAVGLATLEKRAEEGDEGAIAQLRQYAGVGEGNAEMIVLPDGVESDNKASTDVNSPLGQQKRAFALYELAKLAGVAH